MKKLFSTLALLFISVTMFSQQQVDVVNKTGCPVYFNLIATDTQCSGTGTQQHIDFFLPPYSTTVKTVNSNFEFTAAKSTQFDMTQSCYDNSVYVSPNSACINCNPYSYPESGSSYTPNSCACDDKIYMEWFTNCSGSTYNSQIVVYY